MSDFIDVILIEDNAAFSASIETMLKLNSDMNCNACFESAEACLAALKDTPPEASVFLLDILLPGKNGLTLVPVLRERYPDSRILVLNQDDDYHSTLEAIGLGVSGYVLKSASIEDIERAIREVHNGGCVIDPQLSRLVLDALNSGDSVEDSVLSKRERQVLELLAMGYVKKEVAGELGLSYYTIVEYTENIFKKLQTPNIAAAIAAAIRKGLI